VQQSF